jgi:uncharacterized protein YndB with AHSA1/START domain
VGHGGAVENAIEIRASCERVFDYCTDMLREPEWNPRMRQVAKTTDGPIGAGTRWETGFMKNDAMIVEYMHFERPTTWESVGHSRRLEVKMVGEVSSTEDGRASSFAPNCTGKARSGSCSRCSRASSTSVKSAIWLQSRPRSNGDQSSERHRPPTASSSAAIVSHFHQKATTGEPFQASAAALDMCGRGS